MFTLPKNPMPFESATLERFDLFVPLVFVIGGPGSGKGTQCAKIVEEYGFSHFSSGDLLREECASGSERGKRLTAIMEAGYLVPGDEVLVLVRNAIVKVKQNAKGFLIDGYPREASQAVIFERHVTHCHLVLYLKVPDDVLVARLLERGKTSGRVDDNEETIKQRLITFHSQIDPILEYYKGSVTKVNAVGTPEEVYERVSPAIQDVFW